MSYTPPDHITQIHNEATSGHIIETKTETREPISEKDCIKMGGHCWNHYMEAECVDKFGNKTGMTLAMYLTNPREYRTCKHCGKKQVKTPGVWNDE